MSEEVAKLLVRWEKWEADLLSDDNHNLVDDLSDELYDEMMELQELRNEILRAVGDRR